MSGLPDDVKADLARHRLDLLRRETASLADVRRILREIESSSSIDGRMRGEAHRSVGLGEETQRLGILDAHRVGASVAELVAATGMDEAAIAEVLRRAG